MTDRSDAETIAAGLYAHRKIAVMLAGDLSRKKHLRAGDLFPKHISKIEAQTWLKRVPVFESYYHNGYLAYRLTPLGLEVRRQLLEGADNGKD